jgi:hypothetical protein
MPFARLVFGTGTWELEIRNSKFETRNPNLEANPVPRPDRQETGSGSTPPSEFSEGERRAVAPSYPEMLKKTRVLSPETDILHDLAKRQHAEYKRVKFLPLEGVGANSGRVKVQVYPEMLMKTNGRENQNAEYPEMFMKTKGFWLVSGNV